MTTGTAAGPVLRPYQAEAVDRPLDEIARRRHAMLVLPTGSGKTVVAGQVVSEVINRGGRVVAVAHRRELVTQFSKKLHAAGVVDHGIVRADFPMRLGAPVQVCSIQTLHARTALHKKIELPPDERGYARGWAAHKHRERFGDWPATRFAEPIEPDAATRSWVRSGQIAYAKSMQQQAAP